MLRQSTCQMDNCYVRKQPNKIEIENMDKFMLNADSSMLTVIPETVRADLNKIKAYYKRSLESSKRNKASNR